MTAAVCLVDTSMGNLRSVARSLERAGASVTVTDEPSVIASADRLVVPGQGHFADCARVFAGPIGEAVRAHIARERPYLGICLGMQVLFEGSEEAPGAAGLGVFAGQVRRFAPDAPDPDDPTRRRKVPHMGWNEVRGDHPMLPADDWFFFVHSYRCVPEDASLTVGVADYGEPFCAAVARGRVLAVQFHPEKSQRAGAEVLRAFVEDRWS